MYKGLQRCHFVPLVRSEKSEKRSKKAGPDNTPRGNIYYNLNQINIPKSTHQVIQPKLKINTPGDSYEHEADRVADQVMQTTGRSAARSDEVNRNEIPVPPAPRIRNFQSRLSARQSHGRPLDTDTHQEMSTRFGHNFDNVRIHDDMQSARLNDSINARAFTLRNNIFFNRNEYQPNSIMGKRLLTHELTHVVQQGYGNSAGIIMRQHSGAEEAVEEEGRRFRAGRREDLGRIIQGMRFRKVLQDCSPESGIQLMTLLERVRRRAMSNRACGQFFQQTFGFGPERVLDLSGPPTVMIDPELTVSGRTRCPSPSVRLQPAICTSPLQDRVIMHELTHYAGCLVNGRPTSEETASNGEDICMGTVAQELERHREQAREQSPVRK
jgi:hypothetical protein